MGFGGGPSTPQGSGALFDVTPDTVFAAQLAAQGTVHSTTVTGEEDTQIAAQLYHFLPDRIYRRFNKIERLTDMVRQALATDADDHSRWHRSLKPLQEHSFSNEFAHAIKLLCDRYGVSQANSGSQLSRLCRLFGTTQLKTQRKAKFRNDLVVQVLKEVFPDVSPDAQGIEPVDSFAADLLRYGAQCVSDFFVRYLRYVGPLRADPLSPLSFSGGEADDVGTKGQLAAAVFDSNRHQNVEFFDPISGDEKNGSLEDALDVWASFIGIGHHLSTSEHQISGMAWRVQALPGAPERPLQAVGVGVSQVLPILVAGLLAPRGSLLLVEQPELHLHPRAQARLAHFFVSLANTGRQCVVETHSEYLVNELRLLRISNEQLSRSVTMYFADQTEAGSTCFRRVGLGECGGTLDWPVGFFDETPRQEQEITRLAILKQSSKQKRGEG